MLNTAIETIRELSCEQRASIEGREVEPVHRAQETRFGLLVDLSQQERHEMPVLPSLVERPLRAPETESAAGEATPQRIPFRLEQGPGGPLQVGPCVASPIPRPLSPVELAHELFTVLLVKVGLDVWIRLIDFPDRAPEGNRLADPPDRLPRAL